MSQVFLDDGTRVPVTVVSIVDNVVTQHKLDDKDGYTAVQLGIGQTKKLKKPLASHVEKANIDTLPKFFREVRLSADADVSTLAVGSKLAVSELFTPGDQLKVTGTSKGKGFAGGVKRHGFGGGPKTHGQSDRHRAPGAIGQGTTPGRVYKGKRMAGRMGTDTVSVTNLYVVDIQGSDVYVSGLIPGSKNALVRLEKTGEKKHFVPVFRIQEEVSEEPKDSDMTQETTEETAVSTETPQAEEPQKVSKTEDQKETASNATDTDKPHDTKEEVESAKSVTSDVSESESVDDADTETKAEETKEEKENGGK